MTFDEAYKSLNAKQKEAVDTIDGPVMVVAGPGTGKTQLLATRAANILKKDSTLLPTNILCLTFTESGQVAMQRRLIDLMGEAGAHVAVHTFHSFGTEIINTYPQYFYQGANYSPSDDLATHEILSDILKTLPYKNALASKNQGEFVYLKDIKDILSKLKKSAITPKQLRLLAMDAYNFSEYLEPELFALFDVARFTGKKDIERSAFLLDFAAKYKQPHLNVAGFLPLSKIFIEIFGDAVQAALDAGSAKPINDFKKDWFSKDRSRLINKQRDNADKLLALADIYEDYQKALDTRHLFDYDDMIMRVVQALEKHGDLAYELQEQYQYFLVDEFQDTNTGQMRMLNALAEHPVNESRPNVLVVGDDDQAIYAFQGAELSNILNFYDSYKNVKLITLTDNYRSDKEILKASRAIIIQGEDRLESKLPDKLNKTLAAQTRFDTPDLTRQLFNIQAHEFEWVAEEINNLINGGHEPKEIAVICREHKYLENLLPYLYSLGIPVTYEHRKNALDNKAIQELVTLARVVGALSKNDLVLAEGYLPELLSADYWQIDASAIWQLSLSSRRAYEKARKKVFWLELMQSKDADVKSKKIAIFLLETAKIARTHGLEVVLDLLIGNTKTGTADDTADESDELFDYPKLKIKSPFKDYYFSPDLLKLKPEKYIDMLSSLSAIRNHLRQYRPGIKLDLDIFIDFVDLCTEAKINIKVRGVHGSPENSVTLTTAHGAKGLEFETVFLLSAVNKVWEGKGKSRLISLPPNMFAVAHKNNPDDNLRLFYVSMTRAKRQLFICSYLEGDDGKPVTNFAALEHESVKAILPSPIEPTVLPDTSESLLNRVERTWYDKHYQVPLKNMKELLGERLDNYSLSITHLINYLNVTKGGPNNYLLTNLLQFPSAMSPSASYGSSVHDTLEFIHNNFAKNNKLPNQKEICSFFERSLKFKRLDKKDEAHFLQRGIEALEAFIKNQKGEFNNKQIAEQNFYSQGVMLGDAKLTGKLDVLEINKLKAKVTDYKTGKAIEDWDVKGKNVYDKIKTHHYKQQLYFYKLLVEGSRQWGDNGIKLTEANLVFVEPTRQREIIRLQLNPSESLEIDRLEKLIKAVWQKIINLDFPDTSEYEPSIKGIIAFENHLIDNFKQ
ncbi:MAG TPA: ATP-dependent DNA helicase [Patescibacteria group bacterium]|nr:ATP-dependent DNA helicase [Patescibacteria group bacterium]